MKKTLRKAAIGIAMVASPIALVGCNKQIVDLDYKFDKAYVKIGEEWKDLDVKSWGDYDGEQLQLKLEDGTVIIVHSANCILYKGELPVGGDR